MKYMKLQTYEIREVPNTEIDIVVMGVLEVTERFHHGSVHNSLETLCFLRKGQDQFL